MNRIVAYACLGLSRSLLASDFALSKPLVAALPVFLLAWLRFGIGGYHELAAFTRTHSASGMADCCPYGRRQKTTGSISPKRITALINLGELALITPFSLWVGWRFDFSAVTGISWLLLLFYALTASGPYGYG